MNSEIYAVCTLTCHRHHERHVHCASCPTTPRCVRRRIHIKLPANMVTELDAAILTYLISRGFTRSTKAFEKESGAKVDGAKDLKQVWLASQSR